jgi:hypothetical protein
MGDGSVRFLSASIGLSRYELDGVKVLDSFWHEAAQELKLGARREDWQSLPGVTVVPEPDGPGFFSYATLADATELVVETPALERQMLRALKLAQAADARGQQAAQDRYMDQYRRLALGSRNRLFSLLDRTNLYTYAYMLRQSSVPLTP